MQALKSEYDDVGAPLTIDTMTEYIRMKLPPEYEHQQSQMHDQVNMTWERMRRMLKERERILNARKVMKTKESAEAYFAGQCHSFKRSDRRGDLKSIRQCGFTCHFCGKKGHGRRDCKLRKIFMSQGIKHQAHEGGGPTKV
jgi:hypothetical protein